MVNPTDTAGNAEEEEDAVPCLGLTSDLKTGTLASHPARHLEFQGQRWGPE